MKKSMLFAMLTAMVLAFIPTSIIAVSASSATGNNTVTDNTALPVPTGVSWKDGYTASWNQVENAGAYEIQLYYDNAGEPIRLYRGFMALRNEDGTAESDFSDYFTESGKYYFKVQAQVLSNGNSGTVTGRSEWSDYVYQEYTRPEAEMPGATAAWDQTKAGTVHFTSVGAAGGYKVRIYFRATETEQWEFEGWSGSNRSVAAGEKVEVDLSDFVSRNGSGQYYVTVQTLSDDIDTIANSREGAPSEIYDTRDNASILNDILEKVDENAPASTVVDTLKDSADLSQIQEAMQTDDGFRSKMEAIEANYKEEKGITVEPPAVAEEAQKYVDASKVEVVGAAFNGADNSKIGLNIGLVSEEKLPDTSAYKASVVLDIKLTSEGNDIHELTMPITVTIPLPSGLNAANLILIHHLSDGRVEHLPVKYNSNDNTVTFTVTSFSTFVFAEKEEEEEHASSGSTETVSKVSGLIWAAPAGDTVRIRKEDGITSLTSSVMKEFAARGDINIDMEFTYNGQDYHIYIPAGTELDPTIPVYGPLYLNAYFGQNAPAQGGNGTYVVVSGDTLSRIAASNGMTLAQLMAKNPGIKDMNYIYVGQTIIIK